MSDQSYIQGLLEELLESGRTPEQVCGEHPELLREVRERWHAMRAVEAQVEALFPTQAVPGRTGHLRRTMGGDGPGGMLPRIPGYEIESVLGTGGMGVVYKARHVKLKRPVAIKMVLAGANAAPMERACLIREAEAVAGLRHANIVAVHDVGELDGLPYFTMEFVEGGTLAGKLAGVPQPAREAAELTAVLADAVQTAHKGGIVHRDLKPSNILLTADGSPKIADFSLARGFGAESSITLSGARIGTPSYMAPEQVMGTANAFFPAVDVYALGAVLYEVLTGRPPFRAETPEETYRQVVGAEPAPPSRLNARVPRDLETICLKCLSKEPARRYATAAALAEDLRRFLDGKPIQARAVSVWERSWRLVKRNRAATALVATALVCIGLVAFAGLREWRIRIMQRAEIARWEDRLASVVSLQREGRIAEARATLMGGTRAVSEPLHKRIEAAQADLELAEKLDAVRMNRGKFTRGGGIDYPLCSRQYALVFKEARLGEIGDAVAGVAARLRASPIRAAILSALDDWAACAVAEDRAWILAVARGVDSDPWRDRVRDQEHWADVAAIADAASQVDVDRQPVTLMVALGTRWRRLGGDPTAFLKRVQQRHPDDFWANFELGHLYSPRDAAVAASYSRAAVAIRPAAAPAQFNLGINLQTLGEFEEASEHYRRAVAADPEHSWARVNLAVCLASMGRLQDATDEIAVVRRQEPEDRDVWGVHRGLLLRQGRREEALADWKLWLDGHAAKPEDIDGYAELSLLAGHEAEYRRVCDEMVARLGVSDDPRACERTGRACLLSPKVTKLTWVGAALIDRALAADSSRYEPWVRPYFVVAKALAELRLDRPEAAITLLRGEAATVLGPVPKLIVAMSQQKMGHVNEARHTLAEAMVSYDWRGGRLDTDVAVIYHILRQQAEGVLLTDIDGFLAGTYTPRGSDECLGLLGVCGSRDLTRAGSELYARAFEASPELVESPLTAMRYNGACLAAVAGTGQGADAPADAAERARLRGRALAWLRADLTLWRLYLDRGDALGGATLRASLGHWRSDADLSSLREGKAFETLQNNERQQWRTLWEEADALVERSKRLMK